MTPQEFYENLSKKDTPTRMVLPSLPIHINQADVIAAKLILWLVNEMPPDFTQGECEDVLDAAKWWLTFWGSANSAREETTK